jgi:hypothetical protein
MDALLALLDRFLSSILMSMVFAFISFSFFTGRFPPAKEDMSKAFNLMKQMYTGTKELKEGSETLNAKQAAGQSLSLEQIAEFQKLQLRQTESMIELTKLFIKFPKSNPNPEVSEKLAHLSEQLDSSQKELGSIANQIQMMMAAPSTPAQ